MNSMKNIRIEKVTLNIGAGKDQTRLEKAVMLLKHITSGTPVKTITQKNIPAFIAALYYLFNFATVQYFYVPFEAFSSFYGVFPWLLYFVIKYLNQPSHRSLTHYMLFSLFAILITLNWRQNWKSELFVFLSAMFAVFSKESSIAIIIPVFLLAKNKVVRGGMLILFLIAYFSIRFLVLGSHMVGTDATVAEDVLAHVSTSERVRTAFSIIPVAVGKIVFPAHLSADYSFRQIEVVQTWSWLMVGGIGIFLVVSAFLVIKP